MHEMSICEGIVQVLEQSAAAQGFKKVKSVWLEIGRFAGVERTALEFSFDVVTRNTLADGAVLHIIDIPADAWCLPCSGPVDVMQRFDPCPNCGSHQLQISGGEELRIKELEVE
jgi:hydrogenase nickel incorporation protein HypA/HybF